MFAKLVKHEFRSVSKPLTFLSIAAVAAGLIGSLLMWYFLSNIDIEGKELPSILAILMLVGIYISLLAYSVASMIIIYYRFYKSKFTDEGYLTFTLPVSTHQILLSSILNQLIWSAIISVVLFICFGLILAPPISMVAKEISGQMDWNLLFQELDGVFPVGSFVITAICGEVYSLVLPLLSITIGSLVAKKHKILASFGIGYGITMAVSTLTSFISIADMIRQTLTNDSIYYEPTISMSSLLIPSMIMLVIGVGGYFLMHYLIERKLNI